MRGRTKTFWHRNATAAFRAACVALVLLASLLAVVPPAGATTLLGDANVEQSSDYNPAGVVEAFSTVAASAGTVTTLTVYVDNGSTATTMIAGLYADAGGKPGGLLAQGVSAGPIAGTWNTVGIAATALTSGTTYWIAILAPSGAGILRYRDKGNGGTPTLSANQAAGGTLPTSWVTTQSFSEGPISAYGSDGGAAIGPQISAVQSGGLTASSATVTWTTDVPSTSQVEYGTSPAHGSSTTRDATLVTNHSQTVTGLTSGTLYNFDVVSANASGQSTTSPNFSFGTTGGLPASVGQWGPDMSWPLVAVHTNLLNNGKLLVWDGWQTPTPAQVWDPQSQTFTPVVNQQGLFCSGVVQLSDGRILVAGGHDQATGFVETGIKSVNIFNPATNTWTQGPDMHFARWYPSATLLPDGRVLVVSGEITPGVWEDTPEVYDPVANTWTLLNSVSTSGVHEGEYPLTFVVPNGQVVVLAADTGQAYRLDVNAQTWTAIGSPSSIRNGSADMYAPGKILYTGGADISNVNNPAQKGAQVLDMTAASPSWQSVSPMAYPRYEHTMVDLPDGTVFAMGGAAVASQTTANDTLPTEIWDPGTSTFTTMASQAEGRIYHSTSVLMPDGRVLVAGGGRYNGAFDHLSAQYFSPPYLFKGARPTITGAPAGGAYGSAISVQTPDAASVASVSLIDLATDTHTSDMSQRRVPLSFTAAAGSLSVQLPASSSVAPPGYYMLFITNTAGVPSTAAMVSLSGSGGGGDSQPPVVSMKAPLGGATVSGSAVTVSATASDNVAVGNVQFMLDGVALGSAVSSSPYQIVWDSTGVANGSHQLSAVATDSSGNKATSVAVTVTVSNAAQPPPAGLVVDAKVSVHGKGSVTTAPISTTAPGDWLVAFGSSDGPGPGQALTVSGAGLSWSLVKRANAQGGTAEVWAAPAPSVLSGVTVTASQASGGYDEALTVVAFSGSSGVGASVGGSAGTGAPSVSLTTTGAGSLVAGAGFDWDHATARTFGSGQAALDQWVDSATGDTLWSQITSAAVAASGSPVTVNDTAPTADRWNLAAVEILAKPGGTGGGDSQPPVVSMKAPLGGATVSGSAVTVSATASDNVAVGNVQFMLDGVALGSAVSSSPYQIVWDSTGVANGSHQLSAVATDSSGNKATSVAVTVTVSNAAQPPPAGLVVDAKVSVHGKGSVTTAPISTTAPGDWLVAFGSSDGPGPGQALTVSGAGLSWSLVKRANAQGGTSEVWAAPAPSVLSGVTVTASQASGGYDEALTVVAFSGSSGVGASVGGSAGTGAPSVSLTTTGAGSLVAGAGFDWDHATARTFGSGQAALDQWVDSATGDTLWSQITSAAVAASGSPVTVNDTAPTADRWNLAAVEILAKPAAAQVVLTAWVTPLAAPGVGNAVAGAAARASSVAGPVAGALVWSCGLPHGSVGGQQLDWRGAPQGFGQLRPAHQGSNRKSLLVGADATLGASFPYAGPTGGETRRHQHWKSPLSPGQGAVVTVALASDPLTRRSLRL